MKKEIIVLDLQKAREEAEDLRLSKGNESIWFKEHLNIFDHCPIPRKNPTPKQPVDWAAIEAAIKYIQGDKK